MPPTSREDAAASVLKLFSEGGQDESPAVWTPSGSRTVCEMSLLREDGGGGDGKDDPLDLFMAEIDSEVTRLDKEQHQRESAEAAEKCQNEVLENEDVNAEYLAYLSHVSPENRESRKEAEASSDEDSESEEPSGLFFPEFEAEDTTVEHLAERFSFTLPETAMTSMGAARAFRKRFGVDVRGLACPRPLPDPLSALEAFTSGALVDCDGCTATAPLQFFARRLENSKVLCFSPLACQIFPALFAGRDVIIHEHQEGEVGTDALSLFAMATAPLQQLAGTIIFVCASRVRARSRYLRLKRLHATFQSTLNIVLATKQIDRTTVFKRLHRKWQILVTTPYSLLSLTRDRHANVCLASVRTLVLEGKEMFYGDMVEGIYSLLAAVSPHTQRVALVTTAPTISQTLFSSGCFNRPVHITSTSNAGLQLPTPRIIIVSTKTDKLSWLEKHILKCFPKESSNDGTNNRRILVLVSNGQRAERVAPFLEDILCSCTEQETDMRMLELELISEGLSIHHVFILPDSHTRSQRKNTFWRWTACRGPSVLVASPDALEFGTDLPATPVTVLLDVPTNANITQRALMTPWQSAPGASQPAPAANLIMYAIVDKETEAEGAACLLTVWNSSTQVVDNDAQLARLLPIAMTHKPFRHANLTAQPYLPEGARRKHEEEQDYTKQKVEKNKKNKKKGMERQGIMAEGEKAKNRSNAVDQFKPEVEAFSSTGGYQPVATEPEMPALDARFAPLQQAVAPAAVPGQVISATDYLSSSDGSEDEEKAPVPSTGFSSALPAGQTTQPLPTATQGSRIINIGKRKQREIQNKMLFKQEMYGMADSGPGSSTVASGSSASVPTNNSLAGMLSAASLAGQRALAATMNPPSEGPRAAVAPGGFSDGGFSTEYVPGFSEEDLKAMTGAPDPQTEDSENWRKRGFDDATEDSKKRSKWD